MTIALLTKPASTECAATLVTVVPTLSASCPTTAPSAHARTASVETLKSHATPLDVAATPNAIRAKLASTATASALASWTIHALATLNVMLWEAVRSAAAPVDTAVTLETAVSWSDAALTTIAHLIVLVLMDNVLTLAYTKTHAHPAQSVLFITIWLYVDAHLGLWVTRTWTVDQKCDQSVVWTQIVHRDLPVWTPAAKTRALS